MFKIGDKVKISNNSIFYRNNDKGNPKDIEGVIRSIGDYGGLNIAVDWTNENSNSYSKSDLILSKPKEPKTGKEKYTIKDIENALKGYDKSDIKEIVDTINDYY